MRMHGRPAEGDGVVTLLRRHNASSTFTLDLRGPLDQPRYAVSWAESYVAEKHQVLTAAELRRLKAARLRALCAERGPGEGKGLLARASSRRSCSRLRPRGYGRVVAVRE